LFWAAVSECIRQVAEDLDLTETALREWVKRADVDGGQGPPDALTSSEREELARLRRDNKRLTQERDILKAAATFFAKESE
jgi:transposase